MGKALGVPVYQLLGGAQRNLVPCFSTVHSTGSEVLRGRKLREGEESDMVVEAKRQAISAIIAGAWVAFFQECQQ